MNWRQHPIDVFLDEGHYQIWAGLYPYFHKCTVFCDIVEMGQWLTVIQFKLSIQIEPNWFRTTN